MRSRRTSCRRWRTIPAFIHGGPFGNIAHGCNSVIATRTALKLADYVVTEAGFGADLGRREVHRHQVPQVRSACPTSSCWSRRSARSSTTAASKSKELARENLPALEKGVANLERHINNVRNHFGLPCVIAINHFASDTDAEIDLLAQQDRAPRRTRRRREALGRRRRRRRGARARGGRDDRAAFRATSAWSTTTPTRCGRRCSKIAKNDLRRIGSHRRQQGARADPQAAGPRATAATRCASPRRSTRSRRTRCCVARRPATSSTSAKCGSPPAPSSS